MVEIEAREHHVAVLENGERVGEVVYYPDLHAWVGETAGVSCACPSLHDAARFVETVWEPRSEVKVLRSGTASELPE